MHFLEEEVDLLAVRFVTAEEVREGLEVALQAHELLGDVAALDHQDDFLQHAVRHRRDVLGGRAFETSGQ